MAASPGAKEGKHNQLSVFDLVKQNEGYSPKPLDELDENEREHEETRLRQLRIITKAVLRLQHFYKKIKPRLEERKRRKRVLVRTRDGLSSVEFQLSQSERKQEARLRLEREAQELERSTGRKKGPNPLGKTGRVGWNSAKGRPYRPLEQPELDLKIEPLKSRRRAADNADRNEAVPEPIFDLEPGKPQSSVVVKERYKYYRAVIHKPQQSMTIRLEVSDGDADLVASAVVEYPTLSNGKYTWKSMGEGDDVIFIKPDDPDHTIGDIYIGVYGLEPTNSFKLSVSLSLERTTAKDTIPYDAIRQALHLSSSRVNGMRAGLSYKTAIEREAHVLRLREQRQWEHWLTREKDIRRRKGLTGETHGKYDEPPFLLSGRPPTPKATSTAEATSNPRRTALERKRNTSAVIDRPPSSADSRRMAVTSARPRGRPATAIANSCEQRGATKDVRPFSALARGNGQQESMENTVDAMLRLRVTSGLMEIGARAVEGGWSLPDDFINRGDVSANRSFRDARTMANSMLSRFENNLEVKSSASDAPGESHRKRNTAVDNDGKMISARLLTVQTTSIPREKAKEDMLEGSPKKLAKRTTTVRDSWNDRQLSTIARSTQALAITSVNTCQQPASSITDGGIIAFAAKCKKIEYANFSGCRHLTSRILTEAVAKHWHLLNTLLLRDCAAIGDSGLSAVAARCKNLQHLDIGGCTKVSDRGVIAAVRSLPLRSLNATNTRISDEAVSIIAEVSESIEVLLLAGCHSVTCEGVFRVCAACSSLRYLSIAGIKGIDDFTLQTLFSTAHSLEALNVALCTGLTDNCWFDPEGNKAASPTFLRQVNLTGCRKLTDKGIRTLVSSCCILEEIKLAWCKNLTDSTLRSIAHFSECPRLRSLEVGWWNRVTDEAFAELFSRCKSLETLYLGGCDGITERTLDRVKELPRLKSIEIYSCGRISAAALHVLDIRLEKCKVIFQK